MSGEERGWSAVDLAAFLALDLRDLPRLLLCGQPRADRWHQDVERIAASVGCDPERLAELLSDDNALVTTPKP
jgi:hypothetical protein